MDLTGQKYKQKWLFPKLELQKMIVSKNVGYNENYSFCSKNLFLRKKIVKEKSHNVTFFPLTKAETSGYRQLTYVLMQMPEKLLIYTARNHDS